MTINTLPIGGVEFIGMIQPRQQSEIHPASGAAIDPAYLVASAQAHDEAGFDRILIGWYSNGPDGLQLASHLAAHTRKVGFLVAHRPGFQAPTTAARAFNTLDQLSNGRAALHTISGGDDTDQARDGDWLGKDERYDRTDEYLAILKSIWAAKSPVDHEGTYYRIKGASPEVRSVQQPRIPLYFGGASEAALRVAGKHADVYALWGETHAQVREIISRVRAEAAKHGRADQIRFSLSFRPILADTEDAAWGRAETILHRIRQIRGQAALGPNTQAPQNAGSQRLLDAASLGDRPEGRLYTAIARETGARGNTTALVGTPEQVAEAFLEYYDLGVTTFLIRGFDPLEDAVEYGRSLLPITKRLVAQRLAARGAIKVAAE
ncbi:LLM class flavin-dependent oxidoreductase [Roseomonas sp. SSH11]|uniref:LLM class flavin-dependent oxidoreductase n=1 Tax=Pararoseomonas baculiformis TaxID=2820812 RepID=A0ABS4A9H3_9PROT|nr:LLM class flavin-dependent oxidoreductase [Pararoseomonas baculiformis]MBP0443639.1 LLM class flavin-dependent oxidoreductase [Pararoseomonas baculiformis]